MKRISLICSSILALLVILNLPTGPIATDVSGTAPMIEDLNVYQIGSKDTWLVNETINFTVVIINSLHDEPFYNLSLDHEFSDEFIIESSTAKAENSSITYNGTSAHKVSYFWDSIQPNETLYFWITLHVNKIGDATIAEFQINYQLEDGTPKIAVSSNAWNIEIEDVEPITHSTGPGLGPEQGDVSITSAIIGLGIILPLAGITLSYGLFYLFRLRRRK